MGSLLTLHYFVLLSDWAQACGAVGAQVVIIVCEPLCSPAFCNANVTSFTCKAISIIGAESLPDIISFNICCGPREKFIVAVPPLAGTGWVFLLGMHNLRANGASSKRRRMRVSGFCRQSCKRGSHGRITMRRPSILNRWASSNPSSLSKNLRFQTVR